MDAMEVLKKIFDDDTHFANVNEAEIVRTHALALLKATVDYREQQGTTKLYAYKLLRSTQSYTDVHGKVITDGCVVKVLKVTSDLQDVEIGQKYTVSVSPEGRPYIQETMDNIEYLEVELV